MEPFAHLIWSKYFKLLNLKDRNVDFLLRILCFVI